mgnify:FL=1
MGDVLSRLRYWSRAPIAKSIYRRDVRMSADLQDAVAHVLKLQAVAETAKALCGEELFTSPEWYGKRPSVGALRAALAALEGGS